MTKAPMVIKLTKFWSDNAAEYWYKLERDGNFYFGNREWAVKEAAHYSLELPEEETYEQQYI